MALIIRSDESLTAPLPGTPVIQEPVSRFDVSVTSGLVGRWSARSFLHGHTADNTAVASWAPYQGSGPALVQAAAGNRPKYLASAIGGKPALSFDASQFQSLAGAFSADVPAPITYVVVLSPTNLAALVNILSGVVSAKYIALQHNLGVSSQSQYTTKMASTATALATPANAAAATPQIVIARLGGANSKIWVSAVTPKATGTTTDVATTPNAVLSGLSVARDRVTPTSGNYGGLLAEALLYSRQIADAEATTLLTELGGHYGITIGA